MSSSAVLKISQRLMMEEQTPLLGEKMEIPRASFTLARTLPDGKKLPQAIAHRGYKAAYPENTMGAFMGATEVGAHAIETDIHLTKDNVVVLSHDADLKRCFGQKEKIIDCNWEYIKTLRTLKEPPQPMPRLQDLLHFLATPGKENIWLLLDIKLDNDADLVMELIASTIASVPPHPAKPWQSRVVLGIWAAKYLPLCTTHLPLFPITHIGFSISYARQFLAVPNVSFNMLQKILIGPFGARFLRDAAAAHRAVFIWTVNEDVWMRWGICKGVDGVITDDPKRFLEVCDEWGDGTGKEKEMQMAEGLGAAQLAMVVWINILVLFFGTIFRMKYGLGGVKDVQKAERRLGMGRARGKGRVLA